MRRLIYVPVWHDIPEPMVAEEERTAATAFHQALRELYVDITRELLAYHHANPIHRAYMESYSGRRPLRESIASSPVHHLLKEGVILEPTEAWIANLLTPTLALSFQSYGAAFQYLLDHAQTPTEEMINKIGKKLRKLGSPRKTVQEFQSDLRTLFAGIPTFDFTAARDRYICDRIDQSLGEDEQGVLILGREHSVDRLVWESTDIQVRRLPTPFDDMR